MKNIILYISFLLTIPAFSFGSSTLSYQENNNDPDTKSIMVNSAYMNGTVRLKWMTTDIDVWEHATNHGYRIERITVAENGVFLTPSEREVSYVLLEESILPKSLSEMQTASSNPEEGTLANKLLNDPATQEMIDDSASGDKTIAKAIEQKEMRNNRYFYAHILAEKSFEMACAMGMAYIDTTVEQNKEYAYIVTLTTPQNQ